MLSLLSNMENGDDDSRQVKQGILSGSQALAQFIQAFKLVYEMRSTRSALEKEKKTKFQGPDFIKLGNEKSGCSMITSKNSVNLELKQLLEFANLFVQARDDDEDSRLKMQQNHSLVKDMESFIHVIILAAKIGLQGSQLIMISKVGLQPGYSKLRFNSEWKRSAEVEVCVPLTEEQRYLLVQSMMENEGASLLACSKILVLFFHECFLHSLKITPEWSCSGMLDDDGGEVGSLFGTSPVLIGAPGSATLKQNVVFHVNKLKDDCKVDANVIMDNDWKRTLSSLHVSSTKEGKDKETGEDGILISVAGKEDAISKGSMEVEGPIDNNFMEHYPAEKERVAVNKGPMVPRQQKGDKLSGFQADHDVTYILHERHVVHNEQGNGSNGPAVISQPRKGCADDGDASEKGGCFSKNVETKGDKGASFGSFPVFAFCKDCPPDNNAKAISRQGFEDYLSGFLAFLRKRGYTFP